MKLKPTYLLLLPVSFAAAFCFSNCGSSDDGEVLDHSDDDVMEEDLTGKVDFAQHVRPILSDRCYSCHGPDAAAVKRNKGVRLDNLKDAMRVTEESGKRPIVPGKPEESYIFARITDKDSPMPPLDSDHKQLTEKETAILKQWVKDGAEYTPHWAFTKAVKPSVPAVKTEGWAVNEIDKFVLKVLEDREIKPSEETDKATMLRRASFVLTGLAPTHAEMDAFLNDKSENAYEKQVDRLLKSPHFGERMASMWLDAARYADTNGYHHDEYRSIWPYRDWVVKAFNDNMHYDQFTIEQLAGDLLKNPSQSQLIASGFNRCHNINDEGGALDAEYKVEAVADRIETAGTVFMALTMNCCRCHDHKYDPIEQQDYYNLYSFFNSFESERGVFRHSRTESRAYPPYLEMATPEQSKKRDELNKLIAEAKKNQPPAKPKTPHTPEQKAQIAKLKKLQGELGTLTNQILRTMISKEKAKPTPAFVLDRGTYDGAIKDRPAERKPLKFLGGELPKGAPKNRLGLAQWLVTGDHPLTSRVHVNRLWQMVFGMGIVESPGDFGNQSLYPVHEELIDYLAVDFVDNKWDQKALMKKMLMSKTFRQSAVYRDEMRASDPNNQLLSYYPRRRLPAEMVRDHGLAVSGLLSKKMGGAPVKPYQPLGLWKERAIPSSGTRVYKRDSGEALFRRSIYTFIKRTAAPPLMANFDAPSREACAVSRSTTNTPLQALQLWNDEQFLEIGRVLAADVLTKFKTDDERLTRAFMRCTSREIKTDELTVLKDVLTKYRARYKAAPADAAVFLKQGTTPLPANIAVEELAAWSLTMSVILNLDETISLN